MCSQDDRCCGHEGRPCECASILPGLLRPCLLLLIAEGKSKHGYELSSALGELGLDVSADGGRLYRALRHLEKAGLVESSWDTQTNGPARRVYSITQAGIEFLARTEDSLDEAIAALTNLARRLKQLRQTGPRSGE